MFHYVDVYFLKCQTIGFLSLEMLNYKRIEHNEMQQLVTAFLLNCEVIHDSHDYLQIIYI